MRLRWAFFVVLVAMCLVQSPSLAQDAGDTSYRIGVGDLLKVETYQQEEVSGEFAVEETGAITFPLLGPVQVTGKTTAEVADAIESLLEEDFYVDVQLKVEVVQFSSQPVTLFGQVQNPGTYYLKGRTTVTQLLAEVGGLKPTAGPVLELRRVPEEPGLPPVLMSFATAKLLSGEEGGNVVLVAGDVLSVSAKKEYFVTGEVARPGRYEISLGMTLIQAISQAGGLAKFASQSVELHRELGGEKQILRFDLANIRKGKLADPEILSGDVIIVKRRFL